jgi:hypothetical protein
MDSMSKISQVYIIWRESSMKFSNSNQLFKCAVTTDFKNQHSPILTCNSPVIYRATKMQVPKTLSSAFFLTLAVTTTSMAASQQAKRQGGDIFAVQTYFSGSGCTGTNDTEATFAGVNLCQPIRSILAGVASVSPISVTTRLPNCKGKKSNQLSNISPS